MRKILVLRGGALGDFIVTLPALALLRQRWPAARIELVGNTTAAVLARSHGLLDTAHSQHDARWSALFNAEPLPLALAAWLADFDLVLNYWPDPDGVLRSRFPVRVPQVFLTAEAMPTCVPAAAHYCEPLCALGLEMTRPWFQLAERDPAAVRIALHPGSGSPRKNWPEERWRDVIGALPAPILLIRGEAEARTTTRFQNTQGLQLAENLPLEQLVRELTHCRLFLGHDSGISHLAAACGVPSILLFGPTDPAMWAPPAPHVQVIRHGTEMTAISVEEVLRAVKSSLR